MKKITIILSILIIIILIIFITDKYGEKTDLYWESQNSNDNFVCFDDNCISVEIMKTVEERRQGLMFREYLDSDKGMLFIFDNQGLHSFWMKNTLIPLDIIWINQDNEVVDFKSADPCLKKECITYGGNVSAKYVLEVNRGFVGENGVVIGDRVLIDFG